VVRGLDVTTKVGAVNLCLPTLAADMSAPHLGRHRLAHFVRQDERRLVLRPEISGECQHALALDLVAEDRDGEEVRAERQLMEREQRAARHREVFATRLAAPARSAVRTAAGIHDRATAVRTVGVPVVVRPPQPDEGALGFLIAHARDGR
jgi:hypothetical protein